MKKKKFIHSWNNALRDFKRNRLHLSSVWALYNEVIVFRDAGNLGLNIFVPVLDVVALLFAILGLDCVS